jgi:hypothetical protein
MLDLPGFKEQLKAPTRLDNKCTVQYTISGAGRNFKEAASLKTAALDYRWHTIYQTWVCKGPAGEVASDDRALFWGLKFLVSRTPQGGVKLAVDLEPESSGKVDRS